MSVFHYGCVFKVLKSQIPDKSVNLIYIDPPFGTTKNFWDSKLDWAILFKEFFRILKDDGMLIIHCSIPFNYELIKSALKPPIYTWYWDKGQCTNHLGANYQPLRKVEEILVWKNKKTTYYRQQIGDELRVHNWGGSSSYFGKVKEGMTTLKGMTRSNLITIKRNIEGFSTRPVELVKLMIDSYSKVGDTILDCFCYKGLSYTQSAGRRWIGIDLNFIPSVVVNGS
jgi:DNA modification methylase